MLTTPARTDNLIVLAARVRNVNRVHKYSNDLHALLAPFFAQFIGQQVMKQDGKLLAKIAKDMPKLPEVDRIRTWMDGGHLRWTVKTDENVGGCAYYYEIGCYIGETEGGILTKLHDAPGLPFDYTPEKVIETRNHYETARKAFQTAHSALHPFGETDR